MAAAAVARQEESFEKCCWGLMSLCPLPLAADLHPVTWALCIPVKALLCPVSNMGIDVWAHPSQAEGAGGMKPHPQRA